jgi:hypothetical protein
MAIKSDVTLRRLVRCPVCRRVDMAATLAEHLCTEHGWAAEKVNEWLRNLGRKKEF